MPKNKAAYDAAYQRALEGKSPNVVWNFLTSAFEDEYSRGSRQEGARDGLAARLAAAETKQPQVAQG
jgi:hypothetical protein